jgi:hypothetical protein
MLGEGLTMNRTAIEETGAPSPEQRRRDVAAILAAGILRLHARAALPAAGEQGGPRNPEDSETACLEVGPEIVLSVHSG